MIYKSLYSVKKAGNVIPLENLLDVWNPYPVNLKIKISF